MIAIAKIQAMQIEELEDFKDEELIIYCRSGKRSAQACMILDAAGFTNTKNLAGGMLDWQEKFSKQFYPNQKQKVLFRINRNRTFLLVTLTI